MRAWLRAGFRQWASAPAVLLALLIASPQAIHSQTITLSSTSFTFASTAAQPQAANQSMTITNTSAVAMTGVQVSAVTYTAGQPTGWLTAFNTSGNNSTIGPNLSNNVSMTATAGTLPAGSYTATYQITSTNAANSPRTVSVTFNVAGPAMSLSAANFSFASTAATPVAPQQSATLRNTGSSTLIGVQVSDVTYAAGQPTGWLTAFNTSGSNSSINPNLTNNISMTAAAGSLRAGTYNASFQVSSTNATNGPLTVSVTFTVTGPTIALSNTTVTFASTAAVPAPPQQVVTISNAGSSTMTGVQVSEESYAAGEPTGWLTAFNTSGSNSSINAGLTNNISITASPGSLPAGTYHASFQVSATNATNGPLTINVTFTVAGASLTVSSNTAVFNSTAAQPQPGSQSLTITNTGSSTMTGVQVSSVSYTAGQPTGWLTAFNTSGNNSSISAGLTNNISMTVDPGTLANGTYTASFTVSATNAANSPRTVTVTFNVAGARLQLSSLTAAFSSTVALPQPPGQSIQIRNIGSSVMTGVQVSAVSYTAGQPTGWLTAFNTSGNNSSIPAGATNSISMTATPGTLSAGTYTATFTVSATSTADSPQTVTVTFNVFGPVIQPSSTTATFNSFVGQPNPAGQSITINNTGSSTMSLVNVSAVSYTPNQATGWLTAFNTSGNNSSIPPGSSNSISLTVAAAGVPVGTHTATFLVSSANANNSPRTITVTLVQNPAPAIQFNPTSATFTASRNGANPAASAINVTATGISDLVVQSVTYAAGQQAGWLAATLGSATSPTTLTLQPTTGSLNVGTYNATVTVSSALSGAVNTLPVTFTVTPAPSISMVSTIAVSAVQGQTGTVGLFVGNGGGGTLNGLAVGTITYAAGQPTGWLTATLAGTTGPTTVSLSASTAGLNVGTYTATVTVSSTAQGVTNSPQTTTVTFTVSAPPAPTIALSNSSIAFVAQATTSSPAAQTINVTNAGSGALDGLAVGTITYGASQPSGWLTASLNTSTAPATLTITPTLGALPAGNYTATVPVNSTAANVTNSPRTVSVSFTVTAAPLPPTILLSPSALGFTAPANGANPASQSVNVTNSGTGTVNGLAVGTITYTAAQPTGWLSASLNTTTAPATLTVNATTGSLPVGTYTATIPMSSTNAANSPANVSVTFTVSAVPAIGLSSTTATFNAVTGGANPGQQNIAITNSGTGTLSGLILDAVLYPAGQPIGWLAPSLSTTTAPATLALQVNNTSFPPGDYTATLVVRASGALNSPQTITVQFTLSAPAPTQSIVVTPGPIMISMQARYASTRTATAGITSGGAGALNGLQIGAPNYVSGAGWLSVTLGSTTSPALMTLRGSTRTLNAGLYEATLPISATGAPSINYSVLLEVVDLKVCERALTDASQLSQAERTRLDQLGNNDGTYNLGDYVALRARLGLP